MRSEGANYRLNTIYSDRKRLIFMPAYRVFKLDSTGKIIGSPRTFECNDDAKPNNARYRASCQMTLASTFAPAAICAGSAHSAGLCEMPPRQGTKIIPVGHT